jgi:hypothetical protein
MQFTDKKCRFVGMPIDNAEIRTYIRSHLYYRTNTTASRMRTYSPRRTNRFATFLEIALLAMVSTSRSYTGLFFFYRMIILSAPGIFQSYLKPLQWH